MIRAFIGLAVVVGLLPGAINAEEFALKDGDRVVLLGSTIIEREQRYGYWELALTRRYPDKNIVFRNLGWSGDTVFGQARASFGSTADGFRHLKDHVAAVKPTVILIAYGTNEAFEGEAGLPKFQQGLNTLLDTLAPHKARMVLITPTPLEYVGKQVLDRPAQNGSIKLYRGAIEETAKKRGLGLLDLGGRLDGRRDEATAIPPLTDNGMHFSAFGYWHTAPMLEDYLRQERQSWFLGIDAKAVKGGGVGAKVEQVQANPLRFTVTESILPMPPPPPDPIIKIATLIERTLTVSGLPAGKHRLSIDGKEVVTATDVQWQGGVKIERCPEFDQAEKLRAAIIEKNRQYFHRWRPQNETYLFGFRKQEQGKNAVEIPQFDPVVAKYEEEIAKLRVPVAHTYEIAPVRGEDK